jgi:hypothetical protein
MGLFDDVPAPKAEVYTKNRPSWDQALPGVHQIVKPGAVSN